jgi:hypothetical protein
MTERFARMTGRVPLRKSASSGSRGCPRPRTPANDQQPYIPYQIPLLVIGTVADASVIISATANYQAQACDGIVTAI